MLYIVKTLNYCHVIVTLTFSLSQDTILCKHHPYTYDSTLFNDSEFLDSYNKFLTNPNNINSFQNSEKKQRDSLSNNINHFDPDDYMQFVDKMKEIVFTGF